jgi:hypothetical protein
MPVIRPRTLAERSLEEPGLSDPLWRYMDLMKFVAMLVKKGLYLARVNRLGDAYEGWVPELSEGQYEGFAKDWLMEKDRKLKAESKKAIERFFVSCWHSNDDESDAMWKLYDKGGAGVAVRTTVRSLKQSLAVATEKLHVFHVRYTGDGKNARRNSMLDACLTKRTPFKHEKEVRVILEEPETSGREDEEKERGFYVKCDTAKLIEKVYLAPTPHPSFEPVIKDVLEKYGIKAEVIQSGLNLKPE